jgi:hypothetical protein
MSSTNGTMDRERLVNRKWRVDNAERREKKKKNEEVIPLFFTALFLTTSTASARDPVN